MPNSMQPINLFQTPFAQSGNKTIIPPQGSDASGRANLEDGFSFVNQKPLEEGGVAPNRLDFNGILYMLSAFSYFTQSGGMFSYNPELAYDTPAIIYHKNVFWFCVQKNGPDLPVEPGTNEKYWISSVKKIVLDAEQTGTIIGDRIQVVVGSGNSFQYVTTTPATKLVVEWVSTYSTPFKNWSLGQTIQLYINNALVDTLTLTSFSDDAGYSASKVMFKEYYRDFPSGTVIRATVSSAWGYSSVSAQYKFTLL